MDFQIQTSFSNHNAPGVGDYGVDHVRAVEASSGPCEVPEAVSRSSLVRAILLYEFGKVFFDDVGVVDPGHTPFVGIGKPVPPL